MHQFLSIASGTQRASERPRRAKTWVGHRGHRLPLALSRGLLHRIPVAFKTFAETRMNADVRDKAFDTKFTLAHTAGPCSRARMTQERAQGVCEPNSIRFFSNPRISSAAAAAPTSSSLPSRHGGAASPPTQAVSSAPPRPWCERRQGRPCSAQYVNDTSLAADAGLAL